MSGWDWALMIVVATMGTAVAYLKNPEHKAFMLMLPFPFTVAVMAVGNPVDATNVIGLCTMAAYTYLVWFFKVRLRVPIIPAILVAVAAYSATGVAVMRLHPTGDLAFWCSLAGSLALGCLCVWKLPYRQEPHYRTPLPVWIKFPAILLVIYCLCQAKRQLGGFTTVFPMVGLVASYEARNSLWTNVRRVPWVLITIAPFMAVIRLLQNRIGEITAMAWAWPVFLVTLWIWHTQYSKPQISGNDAEDVELPAVAADQR